MGKSVRSLAAVCGCLVCGVLRPMPAAEPRAKAPILKRSKTEYQIGAVLIDKAKREIRVPCRVNMTEGLVELLLCTLDGKTHESVFTTAAKPLHIQTALLLLGARAGKCPNEPDADNVPEGDRFVIFVQSQGKPQQRAEHCVWNDKAQRPMAPTGWVFTGSKIIEGQFGADIDGSIVATYYDPLAILNNPLPTRHDDETYFVNEKAAPALGSKVTLIFRKESPRAKPK